MAIRTLKKYAALEGHVSVEEAETLANWLREHPGAGVHLGKCEQVHAAVLQVLLALAPKVVARPADPWLASVLATTAPAQALAD